MKIRVISGHDVKPGDTISSRWGKRSRVRRILHDANGKRIRAVIRRPNGGGEQFVTLHTGAVVVRRPKYND